MSILTNNVSFSTIAVDVKVDKDSIVITLEDGRIVSVPVYYFEDIEHAPKNKREKVEIFYGGKGIMWPALDVHLSVPRLLGIDED